MKVTLLGSGGSGGVPLGDGTPGGNWGKADPKNPKNRRRRVSVLVDGLGKRGDRQLIIDTSPDLREQLIDHPVSYLEAVLFTHAHADHSHGVDDLRAVAYRQGTPIPAYMDRETHGLLTDRFGYIFASTHEYSHLYPAVCDDRVLLPGEVLRIGGEDVVAFEQDHGWIKSLGFRIGDFAYSTDVKRLDERAFEILEGVELWIVDCLREEPHPTHSHFAQTLEWIARVRPRLAVLTHLNHMNDYDDLKAKCPPGVVPGYDGLTVTLPIDRE